MAVLGSDDTPDAGDGRGLAEGSPGAHPECARVTARRGEWCTARAAMLAFCVLAGWLLVGSVPALAIGQRGHVLGFSFGAAGKGAGQFLSPSGVAVNDSTGHIYVADQFNNRVEVFEPELENGT